MTTRILDLPDGSMGIGNNAGGPPPPVQVGKNQMGQTASTTYTPIDPHPNPYGHPPPSVPMIPKPAFEEKAPKIPEDMGASMSSGVGGMGNPMGGSSAAAPPQMSLDDLQNLPHQALPNRDIPKMTEAFTHDEQIKPNYVPPIPDSARQTAQYMRQYDEATNRKIEAHQESKAKQTRMEMLIEQGQIPLLVTILFFIFHMPLLNTYVFNKLSFLSIYADDGNFNIYGLILKSTLFGIIYYGLSQAIQWLSEM